MTDKQPEALRLADELEEPLHDFPEPTTLEAEAAAELRRLHAENETLRAKLRTYEDLGDAGSDVQLLRMGYAAARLEIESLRAQGAQPAGAQVETAYGATEFGWTDWRNLQDGDKRLKALVVSLFGNDHQAFADLEALIDRAARAPADSVTAPAGGANWQDISTAPKDGTRFVAVGNNYGLYSETQHTCIAQWFRGCWMEASDWNEASELKYLTHWMPLLPLPGSAARKKGVTHD